MKKLIIRDHLGDVVFEADVYMEGQDYYHAEPRAKPIWLQEVHICDPDKLPEFIKEAITEVAPEPELEPEPEPEYEKPDRPVKCLSCGWTGSTKDCQFGHNDFYCPECGKENLEEVKPDEPEAVSDKSAGDKGSSETEQSPSPEASPVKTAKRKTTKRSS